MPNHPRPAVSPAVRGRHAAVVRGLDDVPSSPLFEGRFGRIFRELPAASFSDDDLVALAKVMIRPSEPDKALGEEDDDENPRIPAGYTYLGQFIDHDLTFDPVSSLDRQNDPDALIDYRTPRFDLDSVYGRGPDDQPYLYQADKIRLVAGLNVSSDPKFAGPDLPRASNDRAIIGDPRNDENKLVSQLQSLMIRFHNRVAEHTAASFADVQRLVRWHYQWIILHDFLPKICGKEVIDAVLNRGEYVVGTNAHGTQVKAHSIKPDLRYYHPRNSAFIPVEFSVAAYRFGHSMVRPSYLINDRVPPPSGHKRIPIFSPDGPTTNLNSFQTLPPEWGVQWGFFFASLRNAKGFPQPSYKIDEEVVNPLGSLPPSVASNPSSLAERNLKRGVSMGLPSGQDVARLMGVSVVPDDKLFEDPGLRARFKGKAPLWYYILRESNVVAGGAHLGPVGARIVAETFVGLMWNDSQSMIRQDSNWHPMFGTGTGAAAKFEMPDLVRFAGAPV